MGGDDLIAILCCTIDVGTSMEVVASPMQSSERR
jgi:hypothetical protein